MAFLLILSAMLSAVTGAFAGVRGPETQIHQAEAAMAAEIASPVAEQAARRTETTAFAAAPAPTDPRPLPRVALAGQTSPDTDRLIE